MENFLGLKLPLYKYQEDGVTFLSNSSGRAILADAPGVGKTAQALAYSVKMGFSRILVVAPASVKYSWESEVQKWTNLKCIVIDGKTEISEIPTYMRVWIINYDLLKKLLPQLMLTHFDCLIADEAQYVKSIRAKRTMAMRMLSRKIDNVLLLTGTPLLSRPAELFSLLNIIDPKRWNNFYSYARAFCAAKMTRWGWDYSGTSRPEELHGLIKGYFIRRKKEDVLTELPPKVYIDTPVDVKISIAQEYKTAEQNFSTYLETYAGKKKKEVSKTLQAETLSRLQALRQINARGKVDAAIELVDGLIDSGEKVLVFCSFNEPLETLQAYFGKQAVMITGKTSVNERGEIVEMFQNNKDIKIFLGGTLSAGTGITLTAASSCVFLDYSWNPSQMVQASDRLHRIGQKASSVSIYQLFVPNTVDEDMKELLDYKQEVFNRVIEGATDEDIEREKEKTKTAMEKTLERIKARSRLDKSLILDDTLIIKKKKNGSRITKNKRHKGPEEEW